MGKRRLKDSGEYSKAMMRGAFIRAARQPNLQSPDVRALQTNNNEPLMAVDLNEFISLTFDFNFGDGQKKELLLGVQFHYYSDDSLTNSTKEILHKFMNDTLGSSPDMPNQGDFSFAHAAEDLANDIMRSLLIDVVVDLDFAFGLDITPMFNSSAALMDRIPDPFIRINQFEISGAIGANEWTSSFLFSDVEFAVAEAKALLSISSTLSSSPIQITSPGELTALVNPPNGSNGIIFEASLDVAFPVFLIYEGVGFGAKIQYL